MSNEDPVLQILAKLLADIGELKETQSEIEKSLVTLQQRVNKLEGKPSADLDLLSIIQMKQHASIQQINNTQTEIKKNVNELLSRKLQPKKKL